MADGNPQLEREPAQAVSGGAHPPSIIRPLVVALLAGILGAATLRASAGAMNAPIKLAVGELSAAQEAMQSAEKQIGYRNSSMLSVGLCGAVVVGLFALGEVCCRTSCTWSVFVLVVATILGAFSGALAGYFCYHLRYYSLDVGTADMKVSVGMVGLFWGPLAAAVGGAYGLAGGWGRFGRGLVGALLGAALAAMLVPMLGTVLLPLSYTDLIPPHTLLQTALLTLAGSVCVGALAALLADSSSGMKPRIV